MIYMFFYIVLTAVSMVLVHQFAVGIPSMLLVFLTTTYALIFFNILNIKNIFSTYQQLLNFKKVYAAILLSVATSWIGTFLVTIYYSPAILVFTYMGLTSLYGALFTFRKTKQPEELLKFILILLSLVIFYVVAYSYYPLQKYLILVAGTLITGSASYIYIANSYKLNQNNFKVLEIIAIRYWLLWLIPLFFVIKEQHYLEIDLTVMGITLVLSIITLMLPIFFIQKSIQQLSGDLTAILMGLTPFATFLLEKMTVNSQATNTIGYLSILLGVSISLPCFIGYFRNRHDKSLISERV